MFAEQLQEYVALENGEWSIKGFIDAYKNVYTISSDTKIVSKILEIHLFPKVLEFAEENGYKVVLADHQNYYPDLSFVHQKDPHIKFAVDFKTTYRLPGKPTQCNGFTLGSHGKYFEERDSTKNIQFPYSDYLGHYCLGIIYNRVDGVSLDETKRFPLDQLLSITSVIKNFQFFAVEKWKIASDKSGSGNTANIGSIKKIEDILEGRGVFAEWGEKWFDDYWMNYKKITIPDGKGGTQKIGNFADFLRYRGAKK